MKEYGRSVSEDWLIKTVNSRSIINSPKLLYGSVNCALNIELVRYIRPDGDALSSATSTNVSWSTFSECALTRRYDWEGLAHVDAYFRSECLNSRLALREGHVVLDID